MQTGCKYKTTSEFLWGLYKIVYEKNSWYVISVMNILITYGDNKST